MKAITNLIVRVASIMTNDVEHLKNIFFECMQNVIFPSLTQCTAYQPSAEQRTLRQYQLYM